VTSARASILAVLLFAAAGCTSTSPSVTAADKPASQAASPAAEPSIDYANARITVAGVGDIMLGTDYPENHLPDDDGENFLTAVTPVLASADITFGNLEGVLQDGGEPAKECKNPKACYLFRSPVRYAQHLKAAGFDVLSLANNHARDFGEEGRDSSMTALDAVGIRHSGRVGDIAQWQQGELRIALIAFSPTIDSWQLLEIDTATEEVRKLAESNDIIIVSFHGGAEGFDGAERIGFGMEYAYGEQRGNVVAFSRGVIDAGADLVLGHGPHVPRAMELYRERLIAYSLGNFANYYGISVKGAKGYAPILKVSMDGYGRFLDGKLHSNIQIRPGGPIPDSAQHALKMIRQLTAEDFPGGNLVFNGNGDIKISEHQHAEREPVHE